MKWYEQSGDNTDVILMSRVVVRRNIKGYAFPPKMSDSERSAVQDMVLGKAKELGYITKIEEGSSKLPELLKKKSSDAMFHSEDEMIGAMINKMNHLTFYGNIRGSNIGELFSRVEKMVVDFEEAFDIAYSEKLGFLTSEPQYVGSGITAEIVIDIPGAVRSGNLAKVQNKLASNEWRIRPYINDKTGKRSETLFCISNIATLGIGEDGIYEDSIDLINDIIKFEKLCRNAIYKKNKLFVEDQYYRAYGLLKYCRKIELPEAVELLGWLRFGSGLVKDEETGLTLDVINEITEKLCKEFDLRPRSLNKFNEQRAQLIKEILEGGDN